jgi:hypothetical protein
MATIEKTKWDAYFGLWMHDFCRSSKRRFDMNLILQKAISLRRAYKKRTSSKSSSGMPLYILIDEPNPALVEYYLKKGFAVVKKNVDLKNGSPNKYIIMKYNY